MLSRKLFFPSAFSDNENLHKKELSFQLCTTSWVLKLPLESILLKQLLNPLRIMHFPFSIVKLVIILRCWTHQRDPRTLLKATHLLMSLQLVLVGTQVLTISWHLTSHGSFSFRCLIPFKKQLQGKICSTAILIITFQTQSAPRRRIWWCLLLKFVREKPIKAQRIKLKEYRLQEYEVKRIRTLRFIRR